MQINSIGVSPSFAKRDYQPVKADEELLGLIENMKEFEDFTREDESSKTKSPVKTAASVGLAAVLSYAVGKGVATKAENIFPEASAKILQAGKAVAAKLSNTAVDVSEKLSKSDKKVANAAAGAINFAKAGVEKVAKKVLVNGQEVKNLAGLAAAGYFVPKVVKVDGNNDGVRDICQEGQNAYVSALKKMNTIGEVISVLS